MLPRKGKEREFKKCDCGHSWTTRNEFLQDGKVKIVGYQPDLVNHRYNHFVFFHRVKDCSQFFGIRASEFSDLREGKCPKELGMGTDECPGYCTDTLDLRVCSVACRNATDREVAAKLSRRRFIRSMEPEGKGSEAHVKKTKKKRKRKTAAAR